MNHTPPSKEAVILKLLAEGDTMICLDARQQGVHVPPQHGQNPALRLVLSLNFPHPINITAEGISANLSFGGRRFGCYIPMEAVWAAFNPHSMEGMMWPESADPAVLAEIAKQQALHPPSTPPASEQPPATPLRAIPREEEAPSTPSDPATRRQRGHLRLIK